ncbi:T9SS type A sorting domain-containing protein [Rudanella lutea]|uniref:T9SS type A sorting domain-containing protein n=1 Tax=Rudanella lutea TaxID=451374 RepID=UPI0003A68A0F|nr:T9SS type A sorting domain-containing protein [Rudanella lutea]
MTHPYRLSILEYQPGRRYLLLGFLMLIGLGQALAQKPRLLKDIYPGFFQMGPFAKPNSSSPERFIEVNNRIVFTAKEIVVVNGETRGRDALWVTDGTENGTQQIMFWPEGQWEVELVNKAVINGLLYFYLYAIDANRNVTRAQLWRSDVTKNGTFQLRMFEFTTWTTSTLSNFQAFNNQNYFVVQDELWRTNGTLAGTVRVISATDLRGGFSNLTATDNTLYFINDRRLYRSDGTRNGTTPLNVPNLFTQNSSVVHMRAAGNSVYLIVKELLPNREVHSLWRSDGTVASTRQLTVLDDSPAPQGYKTVIWEVLPIEKKLYYIFQRDSNLQQELWVSDETSQGTLKISDLHKRNVPFRNDVLVNLNNKVCFTKAIDTNRFEFWVSDGTVRGTVRLPIDGGGFSPQDYEYYRLNPKQVRMYIPQRSPSSPANNSTSIYETDGTEAGTRLLFDVAQYTATTLDIESFTRPIRLGNRLVFAAEEYEGSINAGTYSSRTGEELYALDISCTPPARPVILGGTLPCNGTVERYRVNTPRAGEIRRWSVQGGRIVANNDSTITVEWLESGQRTVSVSASNDCTSSTATLGVFVKPSVPPSSVVITAGGSLTLQSGTTVTLSVPNVSGQLYQWFRNGISITGATSHQYVANTAGDYTIAVNREGCLITSPPVRVSVALQVIISGSAVVCSGQSTTLVANTTNGTAPFTYQWRLNGTLQPGSANQLVANAPGTYAVTITDSQSLTAVSPAFTLVQIPTPNATITASGAISLLTGTATVLSVPAVAGQVYLWTRDGQTIAGANNSSLTVTQAGTYAVVVARAGCQAISVPTVVSIILATEPTLPGFALEVSPNPATALLRVRLVLDTPATATFRLFDGAGRQLQAQAFGVRQRKHEHTFDVSDLPGGVFFLRAEAGDKQLTRKLIKE